MHKRSGRKWGMRSLLSVCLLLVWTMAVSAGIDLETIASDEMLIGDTQYDVIIATIQRSGDESATNGNPPKVELLVTEVLRGNVQLRVLQARWLPEPHGIDWVGSGAEELRQQWAAAPLKGPTAGEKLILIGFTDSGYYEWSDPEGAKWFLVHYRCRYPFSEEKRAWVLQVIEKGRITSEQRPAGVR